MTYTNPVAELSAKHKEASTKPFVARGSRTARCGGCRLAEGHCVCAYRTRVKASAGFCLLMSKKELFKPSNTGWLIADIVPDTFAFCWSRVETDPALLALLESPEWQPYVVFPGEFVEPSRVTYTVEKEGRKRPLFILLDATWTEARKIFRKSPYLEKFPVLSIEPENLSKYLLRRSKVAEHLCTSEIAVECLRISEDIETSIALDSYFDAFTQEYMHSKRHTKKESSL